MPFPEQFVWGVASASYQIEGAAEEDGKGPSVWDVFCRKPGAIWRDQSGEVACDHYRRHAEDVALMRELGVGAYRFSISWPRLLPGGTGRPNAAGLDFYDRLVDELVEAGVAPWVTLFHWDYPHALFCRGGWLSPESPEWFAEYAGLVADRLGDRVRCWITHNEPQVFAGLGHAEGTHAPGLQLDFGSQLRVAHHVLLAHGKAVQAVRAASKTEARIGLATAGPVCIPASDDPRHIEAARRAMFRVRPRSLWSHSWWLDPVYRGEYPKEGLRLFADEMPPFGADEMATIAQPLDFFACNIYHGTTVRAGPGDEPQEVPLPPGYNRTSQSTWAVTPECLYWGPRFFCERYDLPVVITENGHQNLDAVALDGKVHDPQRIDYLHRYLLALRRAVEDDIEVGGYFVWTLTDNFEWAFGYSVRVGLVHTDFTTLERTPKDSFCWYRDVIASNGESLGSGEEP